MKGLLTCDLEKKLKDHGNGIGDVTAGIFLRDLRGIWKKADPTPTGLVVLAAKNLEILKRSTAGEETLAQLKSFWSENQITGKSFSNFGTALFRLERLP